MSLCPPKRGVPGAPGVSGDQCVTLCEVSASLCQRVPVCCRRKLLMCASRMWSHPALCVCCSVCPCVVCVCLGAVRVKLCIIP